MSSDGMLIRLVGSRALLVEVADVQVAQALYALVRELSHSSDLTPPVDVVPAARTVLLDGIDDVAGWQRLIELSGDDLGRSGLAGPAAEPDQHVISVRYDGDDLADVAELWGCSVSEVVERHTSARFTVAFCGFAPGFAYCTSNGALPEVTRRSDPRSRVPAGSVGLAGEYSGVYPTAMPGGWQLIGRTDVEMFDINRQEPALLTPGDRVRFEALS